MLRQQDGTSKDPYTFEQRSFDIIHTLHSEGFTQQKDFIVISVPNITNITYGRDVGYTIQKEKLPDHIEKITATKLRKNHDPIIR